MPNNNPTEVTTSQAAAILEKLFGPGERTVVLVVDEKKRLVDYHVDDRSFKKP